MFDFGLGEIGLIAVVALLVLGPERLPKVARTSGALLRKARRSWQNVREEIEREFAAEELKRSLKETAQAADPRATINDTVKDIHASTASTSVTNSVAPPPVITETSRRDEPV